MACSPFYAAEIFLSATQEQYFSNLLVLETTREQSASVNGHIDRATTIIVVFFTLLGAVGAMFGWYKVQDIKVSAEKEISDFRKRLTEAERETSEKRLEFQSSLEVLTVKMRAEVNAQSELMAARVQIDQILGTKDAQLELQNRALRGAVARIVETLERESDLSLPARIRGMADKAYAEKRLGDIPAAFETVVEAALIVQSDSYLCAKMRPLLAFNAACYAALLERDDDAIYWIGEAVSSKPEYKISVQSDPDFDRLRENARFIEKIT